MRAVVIVGQFSGPSEAQWQEIKASLAERGIDLAAQTVSKLAEIPGVVIVELRDAIKAERAADTMSEMAVKLGAARESRQFDETDLNMLGLIEPNFSDRERRTPERVRKLADRESRNLRQQQGKGNKRYYPQPDGIDPATKCALIVSEKLSWPAVTNRQAQAACEALYIAAGGDLKRRRGGSNRIDGIWRRHLRLAQRQWRGTELNWGIKSALAL